MDKVHHNRLMATVMYDPEAAGQLEELPAKIKPRVLAIVERLTKWPEVSGAKPLRGRLAGHYRMRTGDYRVQFRVEGEQVLIEKIGHRDGFYED
jgi:mRNA interferase RelE/StbE